MLENCSSYNIVIILGPWPNQEIYIVKILLYKLPGFYVQSFYDKLTRGLPVHIQEEKSSHWKLIFHGSGGWRGLAPFLFDREGALDWHRWESEGTWDSERGWGLHRLNKAQVTLLKPAPQQTWPQILFLSLNWLWFPLIFFSSSIFIESFRVSLCGFLYISGILHILFCPWLFSAQQFKKYFFMLTEWSVHSKYCIAIRELNISEFNSYL